MAKATNTTNKRRIAIVGTGGRATTFIKPLATSFKNDIELVALCDSNQGRLDYHNHRLATEYGYHKLPAFLEGNFEKMLRTTKPDTVLVCSVDCTHHHYIIKALENDCDVITEKPLTIDSDKCNAIFETVRRTKKKVQVTFNARWQPGSMLIKQLLMDKVIGEVLHADIEYMLNTSHGADYFRRWHRQKDKSGGLMVHKATHHFDLINWWLDAVPQEVFGFGRLAFYGRKNAEQRGVKVLADRYSGQNLIKDPFSFNINLDEPTKKLYADAEKYDGYIRDQNVFGDNITIEDSMSVLIKYQTGVIVNYSLNAYLPREGYHICFNGTKGRIDYHVERSMHVEPDFATKTNNLPANFESKCIVHPMFSKPYYVDIPTAKGGHSGSDPKLHEQLFSSHPPQDKFKGAALHGQGAASALIGIAANQSFANGLPVTIVDICPYLKDKINLSELP